MRVRFDSLNRFEIPNMVLCNPGSTYTDGKINRVVGPISPTTDEEVVLNFNAISTLSFRVTRVPSDGSEEMECLLNVYRKLQNRRLVFVDGIGYFVITDMNEEHSGGECYKDITASSCEIEIQNKGLTFIANGTYQFRALLELVVSTIPKWTIGYIDPNVDARHRTFEDVDTSINTLSFMMEEMQEAYECIFSFDIINRRINVYDQNNYVLKTDIHLTTEDLINVLDVSDSSDDLYTALSVYGVDDITIAMVNPLGTSTIYNFSHYLDWMSDGLREKVITWSNLVNEQFEPYCSLNLEYYKLFRQHSDCASEIERLKIQLDLYTKCRDNIVAKSDSEVAKEYIDEIVSNGGEEIDISEDISQMLDEIDKQIAAINVSIAEKESTLLILKTQMDSTNDDIVQIQKSVSIQHYFSSDEYDELYDYIFEGNYNDEYIVVTDSMTIDEEIGQMKSLYTRAVKQLKIVSKPEQEFTVDTEDFVFVKEFERWSEQLEVGCLVNVDLDDDNDVAELFLTSIQLNWYDKKLDLTFGNRFNKLDPQSLFNNVLGNIQKSSNTLNYIKQVIYPIENGRLENLESGIESSRILAVNNSLSSQNGEVLIDGSGYTGRKRVSDGVFKQEQLKISSNSIVFTNDAWNTCVTALGYVTINNIAEYGINAQAIIGEMIISDRLKIYDENGVELFEIIDGKIEQASNALLGTLTIRIDGLDARIENLQEKLGDIADGKTVAQILDELAKEIDSAIITWHEFTDLN